MHAQHLQPIHVAVRVRPRAPGDDAEVCVAWNDKTSRIVVHDEATASFPKYFDADELFSEVTSNKKVFERVCRPLLDAAIDGTAERAETLCFFAYGHTNSGKTHTIAGTADDAGLLTRCALYLLSTFGTLDVSIVEVYSERVFDLLAHGQERKVRRQTGRSGGAYAAPVVVVDGLEMCTVRSAEEWSLVAAFGLAQRRTGPNEHNSRSSRSHAIFTLKACGIAVCLVDLAGSERQTAFTKALEKDSITINKSLSRLSTVIEALSRRKRRGAAAVPSKPDYVNFRDTMLTVLLQRYLEGSSVTTFIACVHPGASFYPETLSTMRYSARLKHVTTQKVAPAALTPRPANDQQHRELVDELVRLRDELRRQQESSTGLQEQQRQRIEELERQSMLYHRTMSNLSIESSGTAATNHTHASLGSGSRSLRDTKRVTSWLLSRCQASMPCFSVSFGSYFDTMFPTLDVVGYVSTMAMLPPLDLADGSAAHAFLDTGDVAMGLLMLDAGIPPLVHLHKAQCHDLDWWESPEWGEQDVFVLAVFEVEPSELDDLQEEDGPSPCCNGVLSCNALVPFAIVFGSRPNAAVARGMLKQHLLSLAEHQAGAAEETSPAADPMIATESDHFGPTRTSLAQQDPPNIPPPPHTSDALVSKPKFFGSLLQEVLEQARRSTSRDDPHQGPSLQSGGPPQTEFTVKDEGPRFAQAELQHDSSVSVEEEQEELGEDESNFMFETSAAPVEEPVENAPVLQEEALLVDDSISFVENDVEEDEELLEQRNGVSEPKATVCDATSVTDVSITANTTDGLMPSLSPGAADQGGLSVFFVSAMTQQLVSAAPSRAPSASDSEEGGDTRGGLFNRIGRQRFPTETHTAQLSSAELISLPPPSPVDTYSCPREVLRPFCSVAENKELPVRRSPVPTDLDAAASDAAVPACTQVQHATSFLAFRKASPSPVVSSGRFQSPSRVTASTPPPVASTPPPQHAPTEPFGNSGPRTTLSPAIELGSSDGISPSSVTQTAQTDPRPSTDRTSLHSSATPGRLRPSTEGLSSSSGEEAPASRSKRQAARRHVADGDGPVEGCTPQCQSCSVM